MRTPFDDLIEEFAPQLPARLALWGWAIATALAIAVVVMLASIAKARADAPRVVWDCHQFSTWARRIAVLRELDASQGKVINELRRELRPGITLAVLEHEVKRIYAGKTSRLEAEVDAYRRCQAQLGDMGIEG